jgi:glycosyltransferase involved in cell wall biosynthesis
MNGNKSLTVVVPCYNEQESLPQFLPAIIEYSQLRNWKLVCINDGSTDNTKQILEKYKNNYIDFLIIHHKLNKGVGGATKSGILAADTEFVITIDSDGQHFIEDIGKLFNAILEQDADMVVGSRKGLKSTSMFREFGKKLIRAFAKLLMPVPVYDLNSGMRIFKTTLGKRYLHQCPDTFSFCDIITLIFINNRHLVIEENIRVKERIGGKSTVGLNTAFDTLMELLNILMMFNPLRLFLPLSVIFFVLGTGWGIYSFAHLYNGVSVGSGLLIIMAILCFLLGLIAEQLAQIRNNLK